MTTGGARGEEEPEGQEGAGPPSTPLFPSPGGSGHRWIAVVAFLAAAAALVWRCA